jgi:hypothetical protein
LTESYDCANISLSVGACAGRRTRRSQMVVIRAAHVNGNVKAALLRSEADAPAVVASLTAAGYWMNITVEPFVPAKRRAA